MDLKDGNITLAQLLAYPPAKALLMREFPKMVNHPMARMAGGMTLHTVIRMAGDALTPQRREEILQKLRSL